jgi:hypothetical protein
LDYRLRRLTTTATIRALVLLAISAGIAHAWTPADDAHRLREKVIGVFDAVCREESQQAAASQSDSAVDDILKKSLAPDTYCGCATEKLRAAFEAERIDVRDKPAVILAAENASKHCAINGLRAHFPTLCKAIIAEHYGEQVQQGRHTASIIQVCACTQSRLGTLTPAVLDRFMQQSKEDIWAYRQTGSLPASSTLSMVGFMSDCGMSELKNDLIEESH